MPTDAQPIVLKPKRRWLQFRLRTLLGLIALVAIGLALIVVPAERQKRAVAAIEMLGGYVTYDSELYEDDDPLSGDSAAERTSFRDLLGGGYFGSVVEVDLYKTEFTDTDLAHLQAFSGLQLLDLRGTKITDAGLARLNALTGLQYLDLGETRISLSENARLEGLTRLQGLDLSWTPVTDATLARVKIITGLQTLHLILQR